MIASRITGACLGAAFALGAITTWAQDGSPDLTPADLAPADLALIGRPLVAGIEGVPLMPGLAELVDDTVVFDKPEGRIIDASASGAVLLRDAYAYYQGALGETGWTPLLRKVVDGILVVRGGEVLHLRLRREDGETAVHFSLSPYEEE